MSPLRFFYCRAWGTLGQRTGISLPSADNESGRGSGRGDQEPESRAEGARRCFGDIEEVWAGRDVLDSVKGTVWGGGESQEVNAEEEGRGKEAEDESWRRRVLG